MTRSARHVENKKALFDIIRKRGEDNHFSNKSILYDVNDHNKLLK